MKTRAAKWLILAATVVAASCATPRVPPSAPEAAKLVRVGTVTVEPDRRMVVATGYVNQVEGAIEVFACGPRGKTHESVLVLDVYPVDLQAALLLLHAKCGPAMQKLGEGPPHGDKLAVWVAWDEGGVRKIRPAESMIRNVKTKRVLPRTDWVFTGSTFEDGHFKALVEESLVVTYWDPWAIINIGSSVGVDDELLIVNTAGAPPLGTPVTLYFVFSK